MTQPNEKDPVLCYVTGQWAYFTTKALEDQWGDDWDDAPWNCNAEAPSGGDGYRIVLVAYCADLDLPGDSYSVQQINAGAAAWLSSPRWAKTSCVIHAGTPLSEFKRLIRAAGGTVYVEEVAP